MARKVVVSTKFVAPKQGDSADKRCAFVIKYDEVQHKKITFKQWCAGCHFYICENCRKQYPALTSHDVEAHQPDEVDVEVN